MVRPRNPVKTTDFDAYASSPAFRWYDAGQGNEPPLLRATGSELVELESLITSGEAIPATEVEALFRASGLDYLTELSGHFAKDLNIMKFTTHHQDCIPKDGGNSVHELRKLWPLVQAHAQSAIEACDRGLLPIDGAASGVEVTIMARRRAARDALTHMVGQFNIFMECSDDRSPKNRTAFWHDDAFYLACKVTEQAKFMGKTVGFTQGTSPGARVVDGALTLAGVEHGDVATVADYLGNRIPEIKRQSGT